MRTSAKLAKQKKAAREIAEILYAALQQFPEEEQQARLRAIEAVPVSRRQTRKASKRVSTRKSLPSRRRPAEASKRALVPRANGR
jgi:hypothetical protein